MVWPIVAVVLVVVVVLLWLLDRRMAQHGAGDDQASGNPYNGWTR